MKRLAAIWILCAWFPTNGLSQIPQFRLSQKSLAKIESVASAEGKIKASRKCFHRDSLRFERKLKRYQKFYSDSLYKAYKARSNQFPVKSDSLMGVSDSLVVIQVYRQKLEGLPTVDSLSRNPNLNVPEGIEKNAIAGAPKIPSVPFVDEPLSELKQGIPEKYNGNLPTLPGRDSLNAALLNKGNYLPEGFDPGNIKVDTADAKAQLRKQGEEMASQYITGNPAVQSLQKQMSRLMRKYSIVPNSNDLSTAVKRTSLADRSLKERLYIAGNFQTPSFNPLSVDFSPVIGYRFNSKFISGIGGTYRQSFGDSIPQITSAVVGYKIFSSYDLVNQFFAYAEIARNSPMAQNAEQTQERIWHTAALLGIGRKFLIHPKVETTIVVSYNFLYERGNPIFSSPWAVRVGFQSSMLAFR
jgi:hypothetical protein